MRKNTSPLLVLALAATFIFYSCQKSADQQADFSEIATRTNGSKGNGVIPYRFERINEDNFHSQGWKVQQVNIVSGVTIFSDESDNVKIVRGPANNSDPRLNPGCITMNLPTGADPTLRRVRLRRGGYSGTLLADLTELKFSTYVVQNAPVAMVLQVDVTGDDAKDFNIFWEPRAVAQPPGFPPLVFNTWQQWDALNVGEWHPEVATVPIPQQLQDGCTIAELVAAFPNARIIDTPPVGNNGEGVRFTIGGNPRNLFDNTIGYFDALIIGTKNKNHSTLFDFMYDESGD
ncbi:MAG TPA: hypothetical protein VF476_13505 [Chitinophagaceae bacterium]